MVKLLAAMILIATTATPGYAQDPTPTSEPVINSDESTPDPTPTPQPAQTSGATIGYTVWDRLAVCESRGNWHINTGNGYYGGLQEDMTFWRNYGGGGAARPDLASREDQIAAAERGLAAQGWGAWPACSRILGLR